MLKKLLIGLLFLASAVPMVAYAAPVSWDFSAGTNILQPLISGATALIKGDRYQATSTTASSTLPWLDTVRLSISSITAGDCVKASTGGFLVGTGAPCGTGSGTVTQVNTTYPVTGGPFTTSGTIALAFGTTTSNTWAGTQTFTNPIVISTLSGTLNANNGTVYATGTSTPTVTAPIAYSGTLGQFIGGVSGAFTCNVASGSQPGCLSSADWTSFNNKVSSTSLSATYPVQYNSSTGVFSLAFGTTTSNTWAGTQTFTNPIVVSTFSGLLAANNGLTYAVATSTNFVTSITGTAKQITASAGTGAVTLSLPAFVQFPGDINATNASTTNATTTGAAYFTGVTASRPLYVDSTGKLGSAGSGTSGNCVQWGANNTLGDAGAACGTGGGSFAWPWTSVSVYGAQNWATTSPMQFQGAINASSTIRIKTNTLSVNSIGFFDVQRDAQTAGNGYTLARIKAPTGASEEATLSLLIDFDQNNAGVNERFVDIYSEHYSDSNQAGIRIFQTGSATLPNSFMFGWKLEAGSKDSQNVGGFFPNGGWLIGGPATTTATASTVLTVSSTTATNLLDVKAGNNASRLMVLGTGNVGIGTTTPNARLNVVNNSSGMVGRFASNVPSSVLMFSIERQNGSGVMTGATRFGFLNNNSDIAARNGLNFYVNNTADLDANANGTNALSILSSGNVGVGTTTPFAKFAISLNSTDAAYPGKNAFIISSSTNAATTTLFSISNIGTINIATTTSGCVQSTTAGLLWIGSCSGSGGTPGGSATELQYRSGASTFGAVSSAYDSARSALAIGTTTFTTNPGVLTLGTSTPKTKTGSPLLALSGGAGVAGFGFFNQGGTFSLATTSDTTGATTTLQSLMTITTNGAFGIGTNTPQSTFSIGALGGVLTHALGFPDGTYKDSNGIMIVKDEKTVNTAGGSSVAGTQVRTLNTVTVNTIVGASLASNQVTLPAGTYTVRACAPAFISDKHKLIWFNTTDTATTTQGSTAYNDSTTNVVQTDACLDGYFTITASKTYELRHWIQVARATNGLGVFMGQSTEVYSRVIIEKR